MSGFVGGQLTTPLQDLVGLPFVGNIIQQGLNTIGLGDMPNLVLVLGGVPLFEMEVPEAIHGGGEQALHIHRYPGGMRTVDTMGPDDLNLKWSAWFEADQAEDRARQIDAMRRHGGPIIVSWSSYYYLCVIKRFDFRYNRYFHIGYDIELVIVQDQTAASMDSADSVDGDMGEAMDNVNSGMDGAMGSMLGLPPGVMMDGPEAIAPALDLGPAVDATGGTMLQSMSVAPLTVCSILPGISATIGATQGLVAAALPIMTTALAGIEPPAVAEMASAAGAALMLLPGSYTLDGFVYGPGPGSVGPGIAAQQNFNISPGQFSPGGYSYGPTSAGVVVPAGVGE